MTWVLVLLAFAAAAGAAAQRITGLGFALVSGPFFVLAVGPFQGILLANLLSLVNALFVLALTYRNVEISRALLLALPAVGLGVPLGALIVRWAPNSTLVVVVALLVIASLFAVVLTPRIRIFRGRVGVISAGGLSGFMNAVAGVGGPVIALYALNVSWRLHNFIPTVQLCAVLVNAGSIAAKGPPHVPSSTLVIALASLLLGTAVGHVVNRFVPSEAAYRAFVGLAFFGAAATLAKVMVEP